MTGKTVFVLHYACDSDDVDFGIIVVYATREAARRELLSRINGSYIGDTLHRYDPEDAEDYWEIDQADDWYLIQNDSVGNWLQLQIRETTIEE